MRNALLLGIVLVSFAAGPAAAATLRWRGDRPTNIWDDWALINPPGLYDTNWLPDLTFSLDLPGAGDSVVFDDAGLVTTVDLDGSRTVGAAIFEGSQNYTIIGASAQNLTLTTGNITANGTGTHSVQFVELGDAGTWSINNPLFRVNGDISGTGPLTKTGTGTLELIGDDTTLTASSYSGQTSILEGTVIAKGYGGRIPPTSVVEVATGASLRIDGISETIGGLSEGPDGTVYLDNGATLTMQPTVWREVFNRFEGAADTTVVFNGSARTDLKRARTDFFGTTPILSSFVQIENANALVNSTVDVQNNNGLRSFGTSFEIGALEGTADLSFGGGHSVTVGGNGASTTYSGVITGAIAFIKKGAGTMIMTGNQQISGFPPGSSIEEGVLQFGNGGTSGGWKGGGGLINNATLIFNRSDDVLYSSSISGTGHVIKNGAGTLTFPGGTGKLYSGGTTINAGTLVAKEGQFATFSSTGSGPVQVNAAGTLAGNGIVSGAVTSTGGTIAPGTSTGVLKVGSVSLDPNSTFAIELAGSGGVAGTDFDQLEVAGAFSAGGTLDYSLINSFDPNHMDSFIIATHGSRTGVFDATDHWDLGTGLVLGTFYDPNQIRTVAALPGDGNLDGLVDIGDFTLWGTFFGVGEGYGEGDFNSDGVVDIGDFTFWGTGFGSVPPAPGPAPTPEPSTLLLALAGAAGLLMRRRRSL